MPKSKEEIDIENRHYKRQIDRHKYWKKVAIEKRDKMVEKVKLKGPYSYEAEVGLPSAKAEITKINRQIATFKAKLKINENRK